MSFWVWEKKSKKMEFKKGWMFKAKPISEQDWKKMESISKRLDVPSLKLT